MDYTGLAKVQRLEREISSLESRVRRLSQANPTAAQVVSLQARIPQVKGLTFETGLGVIHLSWDDTSMQDLELYEIEVSDVSSFPASNITKHSTKTTRWDYSVGLGEVTYYARARAKSKQGFKGPWSAVVSGIAGQAITADFATDAILTPKVANNAASAYDEEIKSSVDLGDTTGSTVVALSVTVTPLLRALTVYVEYFFNGDGHVSSLRTAKIYRNGVLNKSLESGGAGDSTKFVKNLYFDVLDEPEEVTYTLEFELSGSVDHGTVSTLRLFALGIKR